MQCQCRGCTREAAPGGLLCVECRVGIDANLFDHPHNGDQREERHPALSMKIHTDYHPGRAAGYEHTSKWGEDGVPVPADAAGPPVHQEYELFLKHGRGYGPSPCPAR